MVNYSIKVKKIFRRYPPPPLKATVSFQLLLVKIEEKRLVVNQTKHQHPVLKSSEEL